MCSVEMQCVALCSGLGHWNSCARMCAVATVLCHTGAPSVFMLEYLVHRHVESFCANRDRTVNTWTLREVELSSVEEAFKWCAVEVRLEIHSGDDVDVGDDG